MILLAIASLIMKFFDDLKQIQVNGALIAINPHNGKIMAMMGGYLDEENTFNRSVHAKRQPGSLLKAFGYLAAMESGLNPATIILDEKKSLLIRVKICLLTSQLIIVENFMDQQH